MKQIRQRLTYANVMSSIAVFMVFGGATAFAATKIGANELKANAVITGKIKKEAVTAGKIKNGAIGTGKIGSGAVTSEQLADDALTTAKLANEAVTGAKLANGAVTNGKLGSSAVTATKIANDAVTTAKITNDAVTGAQVDESTLGEVPLASEAKKVGGQSAGSFVSRSQLLWAIVNNEGSLVAGSGAIAAAKSSVGRYSVTFNRNVTACVSVGTVTDVNGGEPPLGSGARIIGTDNRVQDSTDVDEVNVTTTNPAGALEDPEPADGFTVTVYC